MRKYLPLLLLAFPFPRSHIPATGPTASRPDFSIR